jgi:hypothetical protein
MARLRTIKPEFWVSEQVTQCSALARLTFIGLWNFCDDRGVHPAKPRTLKAEVFALDDYSANQVGGWVSELEAAGLVSVFAHGGEDYWAVTGWRKHQRIDKPTVKHPAPPAPIADSVGRVVGEEAATSRDGEELTGEERSSNAHERVLHSGGRGTTIPPDFKISDAVAVWAEKAGFADHLEDHFEHFVGYARAGGRRYVDWDQAFRNAVRGDWGDFRKRRGSVKVDFGGAR